MAIPGDYNVYAGGRYVGTFSLAELRSQVSSGAVPSTATCGALRRVLFFIRQDLPVPITSLPGFEQLASVGGLEENNNPLAAKPSQWHPAASPFMARPPKNGSRKVAGWLLILIGIGLMLAGFGSLDGSRSVFGAWMRQALSLSVYTSDTFLFCVPGLIFAGVGFLILRSGRAKNKN